MTAEWVIIGLIGVCIFGLANVPELSRLIGKILDAFSGK